MERDEPGPSFRDQDYPADPYPGKRPPMSFLHHEERGYLLAPDSESDDWRVGSSSGVGLDAELARLGAAPVAERLPVLAYGSNANPSKITWLRDHLRLTGPAVVIRATCQELAAVWSAGTRERDGQRPAVIAATPGVAEQHTVWLATPEQRRVLDQGEGRGERYRLAWIHTPIHLEGGAELDSVLAYTARPEVIGRHVASHLNRSPLSVNGCFVRCAELGQHEALELDGVPADSDGLVTTEVRGEP